jgi:hypothetical protein
MACHRETESHILACDVLQKVRGGAKPAFRELESAINAILSNFLLGVQRTRLTQLKFNREFGVVTQYKM